MTSEFAYLRLRRTLMEFKRDGGYSLYKLFLASESDVLLSAIDKNAPDQCGKCKVPFTLKHLLSLQHITWVTSTSFLP